MSLSATSSPTPPTGWTNEEASLKGYYEWAGNPGDVRDMLKVDYGLNDAEPIWVSTFTSDFIAYILQAIPNNGQSLSYYGWNATDGSVYRIEGLKGLDEIRETINTYGGGIGSTVGIDVTELEPIDRWVQEAGAEKVPYN